MNRADFIDQTLTVLCYDSIYEVLTVADRCYLHKEIAFNRSDVSEPRKHPSSPPSDRIIDTINTIKEKKWTRPELRYNAARELEVLEPASGTWLAFEKETDTQLLPKSIEVKKPIITH